MNYYINCSVFDSPDDKIADTATLNEMDRLLIANIVQNIGKNIILLAS